MQASQARDANPLLSLLFRASCTETRRALRGPAKEKRRRSIAEYDETKKGSLDYHVVGLLVPEIQSIFFGFLHQRIVQ